MSVYDSHKQILPKEDIVVDVQRVVKKDKSGNEIVTFEPIDGKKLVAEHGFFDDWSLNNLAAAGINPASMNIHTGSTSRLDGYSDLQSALDDADRVLAEADELLNTNKNDE